MSNKQWFIIAIISLVVVLIIALAGFAYAITKNITDIMQSPASTSEFDIDCDIQFDMQNGEIQLEHLDIYKVKGSINSKILDLILLAIND